MKKKLLRLFALLVITVATLLPVTPALAIDAPDTPEQLIWIYAYADLKEADDQGYLIYYLLDYAVVPTEPVTDSFLAILVDVDGVTQVASTSPVTYGADDGYNYGAVWIYLTAAEVTAAGLGWNEALQKIWLAGNPTLVWVPVAPPKVTQSVAVWQAAATSTPDVLATRVIYLAGRLQLEWGVDLLEVVAGGRTVLTTAGEAYFTAVMPDLNTMAPDLFSAGTVDPITDPGITDYDNTWAASLVTDVLGTPFDFTDLAAEFDVSRGLMSGFIWMFIMGAFLVPAVQYLGVKVSVVFFDFMVGFGALIAMLPWALFLGLGVFGLVLTAYLLFYNKSSA